MLLHVNDSWLWAIDAGCYFFDCVNCDILLQKPEHYGTREGAYSWLKSFLCGRIQQVGVLNTLSSRGLINYYWGSSRVYIKTFIVLNDLFYSVNICGINQLALLS